ncbi:hypothetical protein Prudu_001019 [Prunus dulcis]|uniref:Reverse transcriptase Ty1/copia-type domain-containing protein n=1 Tax=Prunus dulcis TaxID=3755 RepID=A0A4Y1QMU5_PRUDU|nr:hypothetical protein Prudu_001019 [Prunus dulcis]
MKLDPPYDGVRSRILSLNSVSPPLEAYAMSMVTLIGVGSNTWIIGTSASDHMTCDINLFDELSRTPRDSYITSANGLPFLVPAKDLRTYEMIGHDKRIRGVAVSKKNNNFDCGIVTWDIRRIIHQTTTPFTPQQNDVFERKNRQLLEVAHSLMIDISVPHYLWGHGVLAAAYLINRTPSQVLDFKTPLDVLCAHTSLVFVSKLPSKGEKGSKLESLGLQDLGRKDVGEDSTYCDIGEKIIGRPSDSDRTHRSRAEDDALVFDMTGRQDGHNQSPGYDPEVDAFGYEAIVRQDDDDRSPGLTDDVPCVSCEDEFDTRPPSTLPLPKSNHDTESSEKAVGCRWVFTLKHKVDGSIDRYKARLVAKWCTQTYGVDYLETFAPVAKLNTFDVKNAFLHGDLQEGIYMDLPPGIPVTSKEGVVCKLRKSLYGLKQSQRVCVQSNSDHTLFLKHHKGKLTALIIYVDDMIVIGDDQAEMQILHKYLASEFKMKSLGDLKFFLGIEVARCKHETGMLDCKPIDTLSEQNHKLRLYLDQVHTDKVRYQRLEWKLIYLAHTRPDIAYAVSIVSQFMHSPNEDQAVTRYTNADWAGSVTDRRSMSGYFMFVGGNLVTWRSKKQKVVSRSSAEAEYHGIAQGRKEKCEYNHRFSRKGYIGLEDQLEENMPGEEIDRSLLWRKAREDKHGNILDPKDEKKARLIVLGTTLSVLKVLGSRYKIRRSS